MLRFHAHYMRIGHPMALVTCSMQVHQLQNSQSFTKWHWQPPVRSVYLQALLSAHVDDWDSISRQVSMMEVCALQSQ